MHSGGDGGELGGQGGVDEHSGRGGGQCGEVAAGGGACEQDATGIEVPGAGVGLDEAHGAVHVGVGDGEAVHERTVGRGGHQPVVDRHQRDAPVDLREEEVGDDRAVPGDPAAAVQVDHDRERAGPGGGEVHVEDLLR